MARYVWITERQVQALKHAIKDAEQRSPRGVFAGSASRYEPDRQSVERQRDEFNERKRADADALKDLADAIEVVAGRSPMDDAADAALERSRKRDQERKRNEAERTFRRDERAAESKVDEAA